MRLQELRLVVLIGVLAAAAGLTAGLAIQRSLTSKHADENKVTVNPNAKLLKDYLLKEGRTFGNETEIKVLPLNPSRPDVQLNPEDFKIYQLDPQGTLRWQRLDENEPPETPAPLVFNDADDPFQVLTPYIPGSESYVVEPYTPDSSTVIGTLSPQGPGASPKELLTICK